jgi:hypothetical protein
MPFFHFALRQHKTGNKLYEIDNSKGSDFPRIYFGTEKWANYEIKYRMKFISGSSTIIEFRCADSSCLDKYVVAIDLHNTSLSYTVNSYDKWETLKNQEYPLSVNTWYWVRIQADGQDLRVFIDDSLVINTDDSHYLKGLINIQASPYTYVQIDDIQVTSLGK